jgi:hypothetical protein
MMKRETRKRRKTLKGHKVCVFNDPRPGQLYQSLIAGFPARFRPPIKRYASGEKSHVHSSPAVLPFAMLYQDGLAAHRGAAWWDNNASKQSCS